MRYSNCEVILIVDWFLYDKISIYNRNGATEVLSYLEVFSQLHLGTWAELLGQYALALSG